MKRVDVDVVRRSVSLLELLPADANPRRTGTDKYIALCSFHAEARPSMHVRLYRGSWTFRCFPCGAHGDVVDYVQKTRGVSFRDALEQLAGDRADLAITTPTKRRRAAFVLACDTRGCTEQVEVEADDVVYVLGGTQHTAWGIIGDFARCYCPRCMVERAEALRQGGTRPGGQ